MTNEGYRVLMALLGSIAFGIWQKDIMAGTFVYVVFYIFATQNRTRF